MAIKIADIKIVTNAMVKDTDLTFKGWVHPQIDPKSLLNVIVQNYDLTQHAEFSVLVEGEGIAGPYTFDVNPTREFEVGETLDAIEETQDAIQEIIQGDDLTGTDDPFESIPRAQDDMLGQEDNDGFQ